MKKTFAINIVLLLGLNLFVKAIYLLGIDRQFQLVLGTTDYGLYYKLLNFTLLFQFINDFGIQNYTNRYVSQNRANIENNFNQLIGLKIILSFLYTICIVLIILVFDYEKIQIALILHLVFNQILISAVFFIRSVISGLGYYKTDSFFSILDRVLLIVFGALILWYPELKQYLSIQGFVWIQTVSIGCCLVLALCFLLFKGIRINWPTFHFMQLKPIIKACIPFSLIFLFSTIYNKLDVLLIGKWLENGDEQAGIYAASMRIFEASSMVSLAFGSLLLAMFSVLYKDEEKLTELLKMALNLLFAFTIALVMSSCFYAKEIMNLLYNQNNNYWEFIFCLVMLSFLPASLNYIFGALFQAIHKERQLFLFYMLAGIISFILNVYLIKSLQLIGVAYVTVITHSFLFGIQIIYLQQKQIIHLKSIFWLKMIFLMLMAYCVSSLLKSNIDDWRIGMSLSLVGILFLAILLKMIDLRDFIRLKSEVQSF
ncbi:MAG: oligosaccharide flippase family protein [Saprospiraceae bacterium]|nr:oligosaccharide flippase family protein [Saprospiraceae bacterium]MBK7738717.1 oligosaccharide flippase family protein [Saprospiraceae bacterium]MBK7912711.1 oligosaccharide flippase family protein [Saprospiraceae bacterium]